MDNDFQLGLSIQPVPARLPVFSCDLSPLAGPLQQAREALDELRISHPQATASNLHAAYMSPWHSHLENAKLRPLCDSVATVAYVAARLIAGTELATVNARFIVTECWAAVYERGDGAARHNHFPADLAAVLYLDAEPGCAPIVFAGETAVQPTPGLLLMFPGILDHAVPDTPGRRVVVAMNLSKRAVFT